MSEPNPGGTTAIQVSPADLSQLISFAENMVTALQALKQTQADFIDMRTLYESERAFNRDLDYKLGAMSTERDDLRNRLSLAETQMRGTEEELTRTKGELASANDLNSRLTKINEEKDSYNNQLVIDLNNARADRDDVGFKHLEVSEALAEANAKLDKFRELLGVNLGQAPYPVVESQPVTAEAPTQAPPELHSVPAPVTHSAVSAGDVYPYTPSGGDPASINREEPMKEDHQGETASQFPSPAPTVEPSLNPVGTEPITPAPETKPWWQQN